MMITKTALQKFYRLPLSFLLSVTLYYFFIPNSLAHELPWYPRATLNLQSGRGWYDDVDALLPLFSSQQQLFYLNTNATAWSEMRGGDVGLGYRALVNDNHLILSGFGFAGRYRMASPDFCFSQGVLGLELLSQPVDFRTHVYLPYGTRTKVTQNETSFVAVQPYYLTGHKVKADLDVNYSYADISTERGVDLEFGFSLPKLRKLRTFFGYYRYGMDKNQESLNGGQIRAEYRCNNYLTLTASDQYDPVQGNQASIGFRVDVGNMPMNQTTADVSHRMTEYVFRRHEAFTEETQFSGIIDHIPFVSPENFYYAKNDAPAGGDGTFEHPYQTVQPAENDASSDGNPYRNYVYIYNGNGNPYNLGGQLLIGPNQTFMGSGVDLIYRGSNLLPASGSPTLNGALAVSSDNLLTGFNLDGTATGQNTGIYGNNVDNVSINRVTIHDFSSTNGTDGANGTNSNNPLDPPPTAGGDGTNGSDAFGIRIVNGSFVTVSDVAINNIYAGMGGNGGLGGYSDAFNESGGLYVGGNGGAGANGGNAYGIALDGVSVIVLQPGNTLLNIVGGNGGSGGDGGYALDYAGGNGGAGGLGGNGYGIRLSNSNQILIDGVNITTSDVLAGNGGNGGNGGDTFPVSGLSTTVGSNGGNGGNGGDVYGINTATSSLVTISQSMINLIQGGTGGAGGVAGAIIFVPPGSPGLAGALGLAFPIVN